MSDMLRTILIMSLSGGIVAVLLFVLKPLVRNRLPKSVQYYLWLVVIAALLVPVSTFVKLSATADMQVIVTPSDVVDRYVISAEEEKTRLSQNMPMFRDANQDEYMREVKQIQSPISSTVTIFMIVYPFGILILLLYYIINYSVFMKLYCRRNTEAKADEIALLAKQCETRNIPQLYRNPIAATPMMIGVFRPAIILPDREYTNEQLRAVLLHELTHLRRKDVMVKWLSVVVTILHWFNPIVWLVRREIDCACELSCDEAVISNFDTDGKQNYGETLLYVAADAKTPHIVLSTTMCEEKKALKERLGAIMKSKKHTKLTIVVSAVLLIVAYGTAIALGAGRAASKSNYKFDTFIVSGYKLHGYMDDETISKLTPTEPLNSKAGYAYNFDEIRFDLDDGKCMTRFQVNIYDIGIFNMWFQYSNNHPDKREGNNGLAFLGDGDEILRQISQIEALIGKGKTGWYDREQQLRYERYTADNGDGEVTFVYTDGEDNGILNRIVWVIAEGAQDLRTPSTILVD